jgi:hypothetical protein
MSLLLLLHCCLRTACTSRPEAGMRGRATPPPSTALTSSAFRSQPSFATTPPPHSAASTLPPHSASSAPPPIFATTPPPHSASAPPPSPSHRSWGWILCRIQIRLKNRMKDVRWALVSLPIDIQQTRDNVRVGIQPRYMAALQRNLNLCIPRKGIARPQSQFPHSCVCERSVYSHNRSAYFLQQIRQTYRRILYINRSQKHECRNWTVAALFLS